MTYKAHVENGAIILDEPVSLDDGTVLAVEVISESPSKAGSLLESRRERYRPFLGALKDMPADWAENHDKYLREKYIP